MTTHRITTDIDRDAQSVFAHLTSAAHLMNRIAAIPLGADDSTITAWLNAQTPDEINAMFSAHAALGEAVNTSLQVAAAVLSQWGVTPSITLVDTRSVADKLADQRRVLSITEAGFLVTTLPPEPVTEEQPQE